MTPASDEIAQPWDGVPERPDVDGWHWLGYRGFGPTPWFWNAGIPEWQNGSRGLESKEIAPEYINFGPVAPPGSPTPDTLAQLRQQNARLEQENARLREVLGAAAVSLELAGDALFEAKGAPSARFCWTRAEIARAALAEQPA